MGEGGGGRHACALLPMVKQISVLQSQPITASRLNLITINTDHITTLQYHSNKQ